MTALTVTPARADAANDELAAIAKALGHPVRVRILRLLKDAGLIVGTIDGSRVCYCAHREQLARFGELINDLVAASQSSDAVCWDEE